MILFRIATARQGPETSTGQNGPRAFERKVEVKPEAENSRLKLASLSQAVGDRPALARSDFSFQILQQTHAGTARREISRDLLVPGKPTRQSRLLLRRKLFNRFLDSFQGHASWSACFQPPRKHCGVLCQQSSPKKDPPPKPVHKPSCQENKRLNQKNT